MESQALLDTPENYKSGCERLQAKDYDTAIAYFNQVIDKDKERKYYQAFYFRGLAHLATGSYEHAKQDFNQSIKSHFQCEESYIELARISEIEGEFALAEYYYKKAVSSGNDAYAKISHDKSHARSCLADFYYKQEKFNTTINECNNIIETEKNGAICLLAYDLRIRSYLQLEDYGNVIYNCYLILEKNPDEKIKNKYKAKIYNILSQLKIGENLASISTDDLFETIIKLDKHQITELFLECLREGRPLHRRMEDGNSFFYEATNHRRINYSQNLNLKFTHTIFERIKAHLEKKLGVNVDAALSYEKISEKKNTNII